MHARNAASVLPEPVGAAIRTSSPAAIRGQPIRWGSVGAPKRSRNQPPISGWNVASTSIVTARQTNPGGWRFSRGRSPRLLRLADHLVRRSNSDALRDLRAVECARIDVDIVDGTGELGAEPQPVV